MKTFRLWLHADAMFPEFKRLQWDIVDVCVEDVMLHGVHPWGGPDRHPSLATEFVRRMNEPEMFVQALEPFGYCREFWISPPQIFRNESAFERLLRDIRERVCFVSDLSYLKLLEIAKEKLLEQWNHVLVVSLVRKMYMGFAELRRFLKSKDKSLKLSGYEDLDKYDLSRIVSLEDFEGQDGMLIDEAISPLNFRREAFLNRVTDEQGRLRLVPEIKEITLKESIKSPGSYTGLEWHLVRHARKFRCCPNIGGDLDKREKAKEFARVWRIDDNELCFETDLERVSRLVDERVLEPAFPGLNYHQDDEGYTPVASGVVAASRVKVYTLGHLCTDRATGNLLKDILRMYGVSMTGTREMLMSKVAKVVAEQYRKHLPALDAYFREHRFVRVNQAPANAAIFPLLNDVKYLRSHILAVYMLKHLRGNTIVEPDYHNDAYSDGDAADALITRRVRVNGAFVEVV